MWNRLFKGKSSKENAGKKKKSKGSNSSNESSTKSSDVCDSKVISCDADEVIDPGPENLELVPCPICSRTFIPSALEKHVGICEKMHIQKRTPFDSFRQRRDGTGLETYLPSNYGLIVKPKTSKLSPTDTKSVSRSISSLYSDVSSKMPSRRLTPTRTDGSGGGAKLASPETPLQRRSLRKPSLNPINEVCPHCGRSFGSRAFDRHVEWCAEKRKITQPTLSAQQHLAKERMQARTKYKAPTLRSKREKNREKYSSLSESMNNLSDGGGVSIMDFNSVADPYERGRKSSIMSLSMTSSIASDGGFSDKYDPFISAKRQLEDLFSTSGMATSTPYKKELRSPIGGGGGAGTSSSMTSSLTSAKSPSSPTKTPILQSKSNFRRTSSLRVPSKKTSPISFMPKYKPSSIQRGISDEGPISSNFLKSEEFDEIPVKSHAVIPPDLVPKSPKPLTRDQSSSPLVIKRQQPNSAAKRRNVVADLKNSVDFPLTKTDSLAAFLKFEDDLEATSADEEATTTTTKTTTTKTTKTSSTSTTILSEKELKDKSNNLNKKSLCELIDSNKSNVQELHDEFGDDEGGGNSGNGHGSGSGGCANGGGDLLPIIDAHLQNHVAIRLAPIEKPLIKHKIVLEPLNTNLEYSNNSNNNNNNNSNEQYHNNNHHHNHNNNNIRIDENDNSIDSNLINSCDNLRISNLSKLPNESSSFDQSNEFGVSGNDVVIQSSHVTNTNNNNSNNSTRDSSSAESIDTHQHMERLANLKNITDTDKRNPKRQLQLHKDCLLFDNDITFGSDDSQIDQIKSMHKRRHEYNEKHSSNEHSPKSQSTTKSRGSNSEKNSFGDYLDDNDDEGDDDNSNDEIELKSSANDSKRSNQPDIESMFEDFDLEEFISSFSDNEQFPIFKNYKEMVSSSRLSARTQHGSESTSEESEFDFKFDEKLDNTSDNDATSERNRLKMLADSPVERDKPNDFNILEIKAKAPAFDERLLKKPDVTVEADKRMQFESEREKKKHTTDTKLNQLQEILGESGEMSQAERELLASVQELNSMCDDSNTLDLTSSVLGSKVESPIPLETSFKSLFLRSPTERANSNGSIRFNQRNRHQPILSYQMPELVGYSAPTSEKDFARLKAPPIEHLSLKLDAANKLLNKDTSKPNSSHNGFDRVLPPIVVHKNDSQNIYNTINMASSYHDTTNSNTHRTELLSNSANERKLSTSMSTKSKDITNTTNSNAVKLSKFCHECGAKFIVDQAKFCMDCGARRAALD